MKTITLVSDQKGMIKAFATFKEGKQEYDQLCSNHLKQMADNPTFKFYKNRIEVDGQVIYQMVSSYKKVNKFGKFQFVQDLFSLQSIKIPE